MSLSEKVAQLFQEVKERQQAQQARELLQFVREKIAAVNADLQAIKDNNGFETLDLDIKVTLLSGWQIIKDAQMLFEESDMAEFLNWVPTPEEPPEE